MKYYSTKIHTRNLETSTNFYEKTLGLPITCRYEHAVLMDDHILLSEEAAIPSGPICLYLETEDFGSFEAQAFREGANPDYRYSTVGQRILIMKDPDGNTIEIGESMEAIVQTLLTLSKRNG